MQNLVEVNEGKVFANSKSVAERFRKQHKDVLRAYKNLECSEGFRQRNFALSSYTSPQNKVLPCVVMTRDGFAFLVMAFTGPEAAEWREKYLDAFNAMEAALRDSHENSVMKKLSDAIELMEKDKRIASSFGSGLNEWKKIRSDHIKKVNRLMSDAQLLLKF